MKLSRVQAFAVLCVLAAGGGAVYVYLARARMGPTVAAPAIPTIAFRDAGAGSSVLLGPRVAFRNTAPGPDYGKLSFIRLDDLSGPRQATTLSCDRVYMSGGRGVCLATEPAQRFQAGAYLFDESLTVYRSMSVFGVPSRIRVSANARLAGFTVFVGKDSYATTGFSTRTRLVDLETARTLGDLEQFEAIRDGQTVTAVDVNYWGVTFTPDGSRFYATLATAGRTYLIRGDVAARRMEVIHEGVECPSLSPDGTKIAFKKRTRLGGYPIEWRPAVLDLATGTEHSLPETRNLDDQIEWLDDERIVYAVREGTRVPRRSNLWSLRVDGSGDPSLFLADAESPAVTRDTGE